MTQSLQDLMYAYFSPRAGVTLDDKAQDYYQYAFDNNIHAGDTSGGSGTGIPNGGTLNQVLAKNSATDGDASWKSNGMPTGGSQGQALIKNSSAAWDASFQNTGVPIGGTTNQILAKQSNATNDTVWVTPSTPGVPTAGLTNQVLSKKTNSDYDTQWATVLPTSAVPVGGAANQVLAKNTSSNYDTVWAAITAANTTFTPTATVLSTTVQAAIAEVDNKITAMPLLAAGTGISLPAPSAGTQQIAVDATVALLNAAQTFTSAKTFSPTSLLIQGAGTGVATVQNANTSTSRTITLPDVTDTLVAKTSIDTLSNKTFDTSNANVLNINSKPVSDLSGTGTTLLTNVNPQVAVPGSGIGLEVLGGSPGVKITGGMTFSGGMTATGGTWSITYSADPALVVKQATGNFVSIKAINTTALGGSAFVDLQRGDEGVGGVVANNNCATIRGRAATLTASVTIGSLLFAATETIDNSHAGGRFDILTVTAGGTTNTARIRFQDANVAITSLVAVGTSAITNVPTWALHVQNGNAATNGIGIDTSTTGPTVPASSAAGVISVYKGATNWYLLITFNDAGTTRYKYMQLNGTAATWTAGTALPV